MREKSRSVASFSRAFCAAHTRDHYFPMMSSILNVAYAVDNHYHHFPTICRVLGTCRMLHHHGHQIPDDLPSILYSVHVAEDRDELCSQHLTRISHRLRAAASTVSLHPRWAYSLLGSHRLCSSLSRRPAWTATSSPCQSRKEPPWRCLYHEAQLFE